MLSTSTLFHDHFENYSIPFLEQKPHIQYKKNACSNENTQFYNFNNNIPVTSNLTIVEVWELPANALQPLK